MKKNIFKKFLGDYSYFSFPFVLLVILIPMDCKFSFSLNIDSSIIASISGSLIGFLLTAFSIILAMPKSEKLISYILKHKINNFLMISFVLGILTFILSLIFSLISSSFTLSITIAFYSFVCGLCETCLIAYGLICFARNIFTNSMK